MMVQPRILMIVILLVQISMENIPVLIRKIWIRGWIFGGISGNGINGRPLVLMVKIQSHLNYTITMDAMVSTLVLVIFQRLYW